MFSRNAEGVRGSPRTQKWARESAHAFGVAAKRGFALLQRNFVRYNNVEVGGEILRTKQQGPVMVQVVQAKCPHCHNVLRIPAEWVSKAMRCKFCNHAFQAKVSTPVGIKAGMPVGAPVGGHAIQVAAPALHAADNPFGFPEETAPEPVAKVRKKGRGTLLLVGSFFFLFAVTAIGAGLAYKFVMNPAGWGDIPGFTRTEDKQETKLASAKAPSKLDGDDHKDKTTPKKDGTDSKDDSSKKDMPKKGPAPLPKKDKSSAPKKDGGTKSPFATDPFPRRALLISVNNYLMFNPVLYGSLQDSFKGGYPGSSTTSLRERLSRTPLMNFPVRQLFELSDGIPPVINSAKAHSTQRSVIESAIKDFVDTSREQDRIILFFAGHAIQVDDKSYLIPIEGNVKDVDSLLPLKWVLDQLAKCKAQQKILVLDVFRYSPSRGYRLPLAGEGEEGTMPEAFEKDLENPPAGVQVWASCQKEQSSVELDGGSAFVQAICEALLRPTEKEKAKLAIANPLDPIPLDYLVASVNERLKNLLASEKRTQVSRLTGKPAETKVGFDPSLALAKEIQLKPPTAPGGEAAGNALVNNILSEFGKMLPPVREADADDVNLYQAQNLPTFSAKKLEGYKSTDEEMVTKLVERYKKEKEAYAKEFPLRAAFFDAADALQESNKIRMREVLNGPISPKAKTAFLMEQSDPGISIFKLEQVLANLKVAAEERDKETSKRWQANFDYAQARLQSRLVYLFEYSYTLGQIRADNLPELAPGQSGWRIGTNKKIKVTESKAKAYAKDTAKLWKRIQEEYPGTPWALLSQRESMISLGLEWRAKSD